ncbi:MAG: glycosyltransferase family 4 protein [Dehalococcoidia bacterium]
MISRSDPRTPDLAISGKVWTPRDRPRQGTLRVGLAIETDSPGGAETMILALARELLARRHSVTAFGLVGGQGWLTAQFAALGVDRVLIRARGRSGLRTLPAIAAAIRDRGLEVLHSHEFAFAVAGAFAARVTGCRHLITMHGGTYYAGNVKRRLALRAAAAMSHRLIAVSTPSGQVLARALRLRSDRVTVVHNGVAAISSDNGPRVRAELGLGPTDVLVVTIGSLYEVKGHSFLLEALSQLNVRDRVVLAIAGSGHMEPRIRSDIARLGIGANVRILGFRADVADLLAAADIFAMPSLSEGLPMAVIEAMLAGRAIVASDVGGIPELLPSSDYGLLVRPGDPVDLAGRLTELIEDPARRARLGNAARVRAAGRFTAAVMTDEYLLHYCG